MYNNISVMVRSLSHLIRIKEFLENSTKGKDCVKRLTVKSEHTIKDSERLLATI